MNNLTESHMNEAPTCLQEIFIRGETTKRNLYLFCTAKYLKETIGDEFIAVIKEINQKLKRPILEAELNATVINPVTNSDDSFACCSEMFKDCRDKGFCEYTPIKNK